MCIYNNNNTNTNANINTNSNSNSNSNSISNTNTNTNTKTTNNTCIKKNIYIYMAKRMRICNALWTLTCCQTVLEAESLGVRELGGFGSVFKAGKRAPLGVRRHVLKGSLRAHVPK